MKKQKNVNATPKYKVSDLVMHPIDKELGMITKIHFEKVLNTIYVPKYEIHMFNSGDIIYAAEMQTTTMIKSLESYKRDNR